MKSNQSLKSKQSKPDGCDYHDFRKAFFFTLLWSGVGFIMLLASNHLAAQDVDGKGSPTIPLLQTPTKQDLLQRLVRSSEGFQTQMAEVADRCTELGRPQLAEHTLAWIAPQDPSRHYLYLPPPSYQNPGQLDVGSDADEVTQFWARKVKQIRQAYAADLVTFSADAAQLQMGSKTSQLIALALHQDPENQTARSILGYIQEDQQWVDPTWQKFIVNPARRPALKLGWPAGKHLEANSSNFRLLTNASQDEAKHMLQRLQVWRTLWRQACLAYTLEPGAIKASINAKRPWPSGGERKHEVVLFSSRQEFLTALAHIKGIEKSVGYYDPTMLQSFYYLDDENLDLVSTWQHETTHQLFQETGRRIRNPGEQSNLWLVEGIAMYFESLRPIGTTVPVPDSPALNKVLNQAKPTSGAASVVSQDFFADNAFAQRIPMIWSLGGFESQRLQYARIRWQREGYFTPLTPFFAKGRIAFQADPDITRLYAQAGGFCHFLMMDQSVGQPESLDATDRVLSMLTNIYAGRSRPDMVATVTDQTAEQLTTRYQQWLSFDSQRLAPFLNLASDNQELALGYSALNDDDLRAFLAPNLFLLQLSATQITDASADAIAAHKELQQLFLDKTALTDDAILKIIAANPKLQSLDLSGTAISDKSVQALADLPLLETLWLTSTGITDDCAKNLQQMTHLKQLEISGTRISPSMKQQIQAALPQLTE